MPPRKSEIDLFLDGYQPDSKSGGTAMDSKSFLDQYDPAVNQQRAGIADTQPATNLTYTPVDYDPFADQRPPAQKGSNEIPNIDSIDSFIEAYRPKQEQGIGGQAANSSAVQQEQDDLAAVWSSATEALPIGLLAVAVALVLVWVYRKFFGNEQGKGNSEVMSGSNQKPPPNMSPVSVGLKWARLPAWIGMFLGISTAMQAKSPILLGILIGGIYALLFGSVAFVVGWIYVKFFDKQSDTSVWQKIPLKEAKRHELYGIGGWLAVFALRVSLRLLASIGMLGGLAAFTGTSVGDLLAANGTPAAAWLIVELALHALSVAIIYWLLFTKNPNFRIITTWLIIGVWPIEAAMNIANPFPGVWEALSRGFAYWVISCVVWVTYLQRSERVRVTFEHKIRSMEGKLPQQPLRMRCRHRLPIAS